MARLKTRNRVCYREAHESLSPRSPWERKCLVRRRDDVDRRIVRVKLAEARRDAAETIKAASLDIHRTYLSALTVAESNTLLPLFRKIARGREPEKIRP
jgi:hypothetical protein